MTATSAQLEAALQAIAEHVPGVNRVVPVVVRPVVRKELHTRRGTFTLEYDSNDACVEVDTSTHPGIVESLTQVFGKRPVVSGYCFRWENVNDYSIIGLAASL